MSYKIATGYDVALVSLADMVPQPRSTGIQYTRRTFGGDGSVYEEGPYIPLEFSMLESAAQYLALLTQFGLHDRLTNGVTVLIPNDFYAETRYSGLAVRPQIGQDGQRRDYFLRDFTLLIKTLVVATG